MHPLVGALLQRLEFHPAKLKEFFHAGRHWQIIAVLMLGCALLSVIIPPFRSPDEDDHIKRAYLLSKGVIVLEQQAGKSSGGYIDSGLLNFMRKAGGFWHEKMSSEELDSRNEITWSEDRIYSTLPGAGYYFPIIYLPQALGLWFGEQLNLTINHAYRLARAFALCATALLLYLAFRIYPPNPLVLALVALPMTLFQMSSASQDGIANALAIFCIAAFMKIAAEREKCPAWVQHIFPIAVAVLATSRTHALPLLVLLPAAFFYTRNKKALVSSAACGLFTFLWLFIAIKTIVDLRLPPRGASTASIIAFYLLNPAEFFHLIGQTCNRLTLVSYWKGFVGILDFLHIFFADERYLQFTWFLAIIALLTLSFDNIRSDWRQRLLLLTVSVVSILFIFFLLLVAASEYPAQRIHGIQGRYFLIPAIICAYAFAGNVGWSGGFRRRVATAASLLFFIFSLLTTMDTLIDGYYLTDNKPRPEKIIVGSDTPSNQQQLVSGAVLTPGASIALKFPAFDEHQLDKTTRVCFVLDTYGESHSGYAVVLLAATDGTVSRHTFQLRSLVDYDYKCFTVPAAHYTSGELHGISGGGVSVVELHNGDSGSVTCLKFNNSHGQSVTIKGCP